MNKNIVKWINVYIISALLLCLNYQALSQTDSSRDTSDLTKRLNSNSVTQKTSSITDTSATHKKRVSGLATIMKPPKNESDFISGMTRYLNRRVKLNSDQVDKVHQILTDYFSDVRLNIKDVYKTTGSMQTDTNGGHIFAGTHNPVDTTSYISPYASLNHSAGISNSIGSTSGSGSDTNAMYNQRAGAKGFSANDSTKMSNKPSWGKGLSDSTNLSNQHAGAKSYQGSDSTNQNNRLGGMGNNTTSREITSTSGMNSSSSRIEDRSKELDQAGIKVEKQIESILTDNQKNRFASIKDNYIDLVRQQALTVKSE